jgi:hypothetical protein
MHVICSSNNKFSSSGLIYNGLLPLVAPSMWNVHRAVTRTSGPTQIRARICAQPSFSTYASMRISRTTSGALGS